MKEVLEIEPLNNELPSEYADRLGIAYSKLVSATHKKENGQFFTPTAISKLMASYSNSSKKNIKILDPGCGTAILSCSLVEQYVQNNNTVVKIELTAYETDSEITGVTCKVLDYLKLWLQERSITFTYNLLENDFILENSTALKSNYEGELFDVIISNPPYFKLSKNDERVLAVQELVSGQPNIYSLFMGIASKLLKQSGELIFITPRSFASGNYFRAFREVFFNTVQIEKIHLFNSRKDTFSRDKVLQETVILKARKKKLNPKDEVIVSSSSGLRDILEPELKSFLSEDIIDLNTKEKIVHLPTNDKEALILELVSSWENVLIDYQIQISTGPVVSFRAKDFVENTYQNGTVFLAPLFWLHNVDKMILEWPKQLKDKGQYIRIQDNSKSLLIPNKNYILLRRFSTKDDKSRLIAAPYFCNYYNSDYIGVENKVNYIYRKNGHLDRDETTGICALLNSALFDIYFQIFNGNVNVSATELRQMKFPSLKAIKEIGNEIILSNDFSMENVNKIVNSNLNYNKNTNYE